MWMWGYISINYHVCGLCIAQVDVILYVYMLTLYSMCSVQVFMCTCRLCMHCTSRCCMCTCFVLPVQWTCWLCTPCAVDELTSYCICTCQLCMHCRLTLYVYMLTLYCLCSIQVDFILHEPTLCCMCSVCLDCILHVQCASWLHTACALCKFIITSYCAKVYLWYFLGHTECVQMLLCKLMYWTLIFFWPPFWILNNTVLVNKCACSAYDVFACRFVLHGRC